MNIKFEKLMRSHFPLLLKWLETPHVKAWWDQDIQWSMELIEEKYGPYVNGYKLDNGEAKKLQAYIICVDQTPVGYIQLYNAYDFPRNPPLTTALPASLAAFDIFIGESDYVNKGIGTSALQLFLDQYATPNFEYTFADPEIDNIAAIKTYTKAGFKIVDTVNKELIMLRKNDLTSQNINFQL